MIYLFEINNFEKTDYYLINYSKNLEYIYFYLHYLKTKYPDRKYKIMREVK